MFPSGGEREKKKEKKESFGSDCTWVHPAWWCSQTAAGLWESSKGKNDARIPLLSRTIKDTQSILQCQQHPPFIHSGAFRECFWSLCSSRYIKGSIHLPKKKFPFTSSAFELSCYLSWPDRANLSHPPSVSRSEEEEEFPSSPECKFVRSLSLLRRNNESHPPLSLSLFLSF